MNTAPTFKNYADTVDRATFVDLLHRVGRFRPIERHGYIGMSGFDLQDQKDIHRAFGLTRLLAFDPDPKVVQRQLFNRPIESCRCRKMEPSELGELQEVLDSEALDDTVAVIVWLKELDQQKIGLRVRQFQTIVSNLPNYSIIRLTLNATFDDWAGPRVEGGKLLTVEARREHALAAISSQLGDMIHGEITADRLASEGLAQILANAVGVSAGRAIGATTGKVLEPLSVVEFVSEERYLSITGIVISQTERSELAAKAMTEEWPFGAASWIDVKELMLPCLSLKERMALEYSAEQGKAAATAKMNFDVDSATNFPGFFENFAKYYRHYPIFVPAEI